MEYIFQRSGRIGGYNKRFFVLAKKRAVATDIVVLPTPPLPVNIMISLINIVH